MADGVRGDIAQWCRGKSWRIRIVLLGFFGYIIARHLCDPAYSSIIAPLNLGIHELGHLLFCLLGQNAGVAGGTLLQLAVPIYGFFNFYAQRDYFAMPLMAGWLGVNFFEIARYAGDARSLSLPLVSLGPQETVIHDWEYMLGKAGLLQADTFIAALLRLAGAFLGICCLAGGGWILWQMGKREIPPVKGGVS